MRPPWQGGKGKPAKAAKRPAKAPARSHKGPLPKPPYAPPSFKGVKPTPAAHKLLEDDAISEAGIDPDSNYKPGYCTIAARLYTIGATDFEVASFFEVHPCTLVKWGLRYPEFAACRSLGQEAQTDRMERSLYAAGVGYSHPEEKIFCTKAGNIVRAETIKHYPPNVTAAIYWLANRRSTAWRRNLEFQPDAPEVVSTDDLVRKLSQGIARK